ncbi:MAG: transcriptional regulator, partial [Sphingomicrobium sp.]
GFDARIGFRFGPDDYVARIKKGGIRIARGDVAGCDAVFSGPPAALAAVVYGDQPLDLMGVTGDRALAEKFTTLFVLPPKVGADG